MVPMHPLREVVWHVLCIWWLFKRACIHWWNLLRLRWIYQWSISRLCRWPWMSWFGNHFNLRSRKILLATSSLWQPTRSKISKPKRNLWRLWWNNWWTISKLYGWSHMSWCRTYHNSRSRQYLPISSNLCRTRRGLWGIWSSNWYAFSKMWRRACVCRNEIRHNPRCR